MYFRGERLPGQIKDKNKKVVERNKIIKGGYLHITHTKKIKP